MNRQPQQNRVTGMLMTEFFVMRFLAKMKMWRNRVFEKMDEKMDLATIKPDGTGLKRITTEGGYTYAAFSPDGNSILHRRIQGALSQIFVMKADGTG